MLPRADHTTSETWLPIPEFTGYEASDLGRIQSFWERRHRSNGYKGELYYVIGSVPYVLKPKVTDRGYHEYRIRHDSGKLRDMRGNRLVLMAFVGPCAPGMEACHFPDRDPRNNRLNNLRWGTHQENIFDTAEHGTREILSREQRAEIIRLDRERIPRSEIACRLDLSRRRVNKFLIAQGIRSTRPYKRPPLLNDAAMVEAVELRRQGLTCKAIGERLGASEPTISRLLRRLAHETA